MKKIAAIILFITLLIIILLIQLQPKAPPISKVKTIKIEKKIPPPVLKKKIAKKNKPKQMPAKIQPEQDWIVKVKSSLLRFQPKGTKLHIELIEKIVQKGKISNKVKMTYTMLDNDKRTFMALIDPKNSKVISTWGHRISEKHHHGKDQLHRD